MKRRLRKLLVANRGEIALRIMRAARSFGLRTVAVYSEADRRAPHVRFADEAVCVGPAPARESYLRVDALLEAAKATGADALHPGYGFLSERPELPARCADAGVRFVGPSADAMLAMGDKARAKQRMSAAGVPVVPGYQGEAQDDATFTREAHRTGFPLLVKAAAGGGGRGMRIVRSAGELLEAVRSARAEAEAAFGSGALLLERLVEDARHIEVQVFGDSHANVVHLGERECSVQRRHQKIIEESPSPAVDPALRRRLGEAAVAAARAVGYESAGTIEMLLAPSGEFFFMEMNTRLQVEHPVTELVTGQDLVQWQLLVAEGSQLPLAQDEIVMRGHAIEARVYAEDPWAGFLPQSGRLARWRSPAGEGVRVDAGHESGQVVSPFYDPMLAKVIAHGDTRELARRRLLRAVEDTVALGVVTNRELLATLLDDDDFVAGRFTTRTLDARLAEGRLVPPSRPTRALTAAAALLLSEVTAGAEPWRSTGPASWPTRLVTGDDVVEARVTCVGADRYEVHGSAGAPVRVEVASDRDGELRCMVDGVEQTLAYARDGDVVHVQHGASAQSFARAPILRSKLAAAVGSGRVTAPITGQVLVVSVSTGDSVEAGQLLATLTAMKMEHRVVAPLAGRVERVAVVNGEQVSARQLLVEIEPPGGT